VQWPIADIRIDAIAASKAAKADIPGNIGFRFFIAARPIVAM
jgi:hypothetical protein